MKKTKKTLWLMCMFFLASYVLLSVIGCTSCSTKPQTASLTGVVILNNDSGDSANDPVDYSGVIIALYELAILDTTLVRIHTKHPQIGVPISQATDFDHRNYNPVKTTMSNADGSFQIEAIDAGIYNVALLKEDWGIRYAYEIEISKGQSSDLGTMELFPVQEYRQYVGTDQVFRTGHTFLISESTNFANPVHLEAEACIYVSPSCSVTFFESVSSSNSNGALFPWRIQSAKDMYSVAMSEISIDEYFSSLQFLGEETYLKGGVIQHFMNTVTLRSEQNTLDQMMIRFFEDGLSLQYGSGTFINLLCAYGNTAGINLNTPHTGVTQVTRSIFYDVNWGLNVRIAGIYDLNNNYFVANSRGIHPDGCTGSITHNEFERNGLDISPKTTVAPQITYNNFFKSGGTSIFPVGRTVINNNNFFSTSTNGYFINIRSSNPPSYSSVFQDLDATNNYWAVQNLDDYLLDANDNSQYPNEPCAHYVIYNPRRWSRVPDAGIQ